MQTWWCRLCLAAAATASVLALSAGIRESALVVVATHWFSWSPAAVVFCGDSNLAAMPFALRVKHWGLGRTLNLAAGGATSRQVIGQLETALRMRSAAVVVMTGSNDLWASDEALLSTIAVLVRTAPARHRPRIVAMSIPLQADLARDSRIHALNKQIAALASQHAWEYLDINAPIFSGTLSRTDVLRDDLHLTSAAHEVLQKSLADWLD